VVGERLSGAGNRKLLTRGTGSERGKLDCRALHMQTPKGGVDLVEEPETPKERRHYHRPLRPGSDVQGKLVPGPDPGSSTLLGFIACLYECFEHRRALKVFISTKE